MMKTVPEGVPPMMSPRTGGSADILRMVIDLLEQEEPDVPEALRVAKGGLKLIEMMAAAEAPPADAAAQQQPESPKASAYTGPPHDRKLFVRVGPCCELEAGESRATHVVLHLAGNELRTIALKDNEPRFDSQLFQFPLHSLATERGSSETLRIELHQKKKVGSNLVGAIALDFGRLCAASVASGTADLPPFQPLIACKESVAERWSADPDQLPGELTCAGVVEVPPPEFAESCRDFTRAFAATASGSGDMLLLGTQQIQDNNRMMPIKSEMQVTGNVNDEVNAAAVEEFQGVVLTSIRAAGIEITPEALGTLSRRLIGHLTVTPAMQVLLDFGVSPAFYQNKFLVLSGKGGVRVATYGYVGDHPLGDRPDRKHTGVVLRMLTGDLLGTPTEKDAVTFSCKLTSAELMDDVIAEDQQVLIDAVTKGEFQAFTAFEPLPLEWYQDTYHRLENTNDSSTGALRLTLVVSAGEDEVPPTPVELMAGGDARKSADALLQSLAAADDVADTTDLGLRRDHSGYAVPAIITRQEWQLTCARALREEEIAIGRWFKYLLESPRICPLEVSTEFVNGKEVTTPQITPALHKLIAAGIPSQWACGQHEVMTMACMEMGSEMLALLRPKLWLELTGARDLKLSAKINYHDMSACTTDEKTVEDWLELTGAGYTFDAMYKSRKQVEKDLPRTSTDMTEDEKEQLRRLLLTFVLKWPSIGYCQSMNFIALCVKNDEFLLTTRNFVSKFHENEEFVSKSHKNEEFCIENHEFCRALLRAMKSEENAFWVLGAIASNILPNYYTTSMTGTQVDMRILGKLVEMRLPTVHAHLETMDVPLAILVSQWLLPIFVTSFPATTCFAVWDWLFVDGPDVLLLVGLAFMSLNEHAILACDDFGGVVTLFTELPTTVFHHGPLLRKARILQEEIGSKIGKLRGETQSSVTSSGEEQNKERLVRQMVKETHLTAEDISQLHERFMELEARTRVALAVPAAGGGRPETPRADGEDRSSGVKGAGEKKKNRRGSVVGRRRRGSVLQNFKKQDLQETVYEERGVTFEGFKELLKEELPQWHGSSDEEQLKQLFHAFDTDSTGKISVSQFIQGIATFTGSDLDSKLQMIFRTADTDHSGLIIETELLKLFIDSFSMFFPGMKTAGIPGLVAGIFNRLEVDPTLGLNFDEFALVVKSQPLLLECFSQQALDARQRDDAASAERAVAAHGLENFESKLNTGIKKGKKIVWKEQWFVLHEGVLSVFESQKEAAKEKGKRMQRIDLKGGDVAVTLDRGGGGKSGAEESLLLVWVENAEERELRVSEPSGYSYNFEKGLKDAETLYHWAQVLSLFSASHDRSTTSDMMEINTLIAMPESILEQLVRALVMDMRLTDSGGAETPTSRNLADEAASVALSEGLPTVNSNRHAAIKACCKQVLSTGESQETSILAMVRRGCAFEQLEEQLAPLGLQPSHARVFYDVLSDTARLERASAFKEHEDGTVTAHGKGLAAVAIFATLDDHVRHDVASAFTTVSIEAGAWIFRQGDVGDAMYLIVRGDVQVVKEPSAEGDEEKVLAVLGSGHCFGEMSLLSSDIRSAGMRCLGDCLIMRLDLDAFNRLTSMYPSLREAMTKVAAERAAFSASKAQRAKFSARGGVNVSAAPAAQPAALALEPVMTKVEAQAIVAEAQALDQELEECITAEEQDLARIKWLNQRREAMTPRRKTAASVAAKPTEEEDEA